MAERKKFTVAFLVLALTAAAVLAASCGKGRQAARRGGTLIVGELSDYETLNPLQTTDAHARDIYQLLFLLMLDENDDFLTFTPRLARSWEFSEDRRMLTFHLRDDVYWSDGVKVTAHDVKATFAVQVDPRLAWPSRHLKEHIDSVTVPDDYTAVCHFKKIYPYQVMDANDGVILPRHFLEKHSPEELKSLPIEDFPVNGPFRIGEWVRGQSLTLLPNASYYDKGKPYLEKVVFKIVPDQVTLITQLRAGEIECMESVPPAEVGNIRRSNPELEVFDFPTRAYIYIGWNAARPPFDDPEIRKALTLGIDRKLIIDNLYYGFAEESKGPWLPLIWAYNPDIKPLPYDPDAARKILADEGFADADGDGYVEREGETFEFEILTNQGNQIRNDIQVMVQEHLRKIGVKAVPLTLEWTVMLARHKACDFDAVTSAWRVGTKADLGPIWGCGSRGEIGYNRVDYCNAEVDSLNDLACSMLDFEAARPLFNRAQQIIYDEQPYTFLYVPHALVALSRRFRDARPDPISSYHNLHEWWVERSDGGGN